MITNKLGLSQFNFCTCPRLANVGRLLESIHNHGLHSLLVDFYFCNPWLIVHGDSLTSTSSEILAIGNLDARKEWKPLQDDI